MGDNMSDDVAMDLDLNQEPLDTHVGPGVAFGSFLNDFEATHSRIEDRIRQLEAVTARARQRQRWRQARNPSETNSILIDPIVNFGSDGGVHNWGDSVVAHESGIERGKSCKRDSSHLVAKALGMDSDVKKTGSGGGSFYDCNICLEMAREPILTCCGHLFCWACFYQLAYVDSTAKECPVCKGEVTDTNVTPIYGNGNDTSASEAELGFNVPPRPRARRIESVRQQRVNRGISHIPVAEALRRIRIGIGAAGGDPRQQDLDGLRVNSETTFSEALLNAEAGGGSRRLRSRQLSSISSALVDGLLRRTDAQFLAVDIGDPYTSNTTVIQAERQSVDSTTEISSMVSLPSSSRRFDISATVARMENLGSDTAVETNLAVARSSSSSRRRSGVSRVSDGDNGVSREPRRRRLR